MTNQYEEVESTSKLRTLATKLVEIRYDESITQEVYILGNGMQGKLQKEQ